MSVSLCPEYVALPVPVVPFRISAVSLPASVARLQAPMVPLRASAVSLLDSTVTSPGAAVLLWLPAISARGAVAALLAAALVISPDSIRDLSFALVHGEERKTAKFGGRSLPIQESRIELDLRTARRGVGKKMARLARRFFCDDENGVIAGATVDAVFGVLVLVLLLILVLERTSGERPTSKPGYAGLPVSMGTRYGSRMQTITLGSSSLHSSRLAFGCWRLATSGVAETDRGTGRAAIMAAVEAGFTLFDHADIYCDGRAESVFGAVLRDEPGLRSRVLIATKCGIRFAGDPLPAAPGRYDFSKEYILRSCEGSLGRLGIDCIDLFQLHRPDWLMNPDEVAEAFSELRSSGKVREFGVSNFRPSQVTLLLHSFPDLVVNQIELSLAQLGPFLDGTLDQCQAGKITPLAWSPLAGGMLADGETGVLPSQKAYRPAPIVAAMDAIAVERGVSRVAVALAWLLKHPAGIVPIIGSTQPDRIQAAAESASLELTREEWYRLLIAARGEPLP